MKKIYELKHGHGWFGGYIRETDVISCVDSGMWKWHILLVERVLADANEIIERERVAHSITTNPTRMDNEFIKESHEP